MFGRKNNRAGVSRAETATRVITAAGRTVAGDRVGGRAANAITEALGLGRIDLCDDPTCENCAPVRR
ncbi:hypothetical protein ACFRK5_36150 [Streptomyces niveus]|uniref:hypothetical protein n=1 Tax=Streptomyces niveus TaxID=193462 RepID=UPI00367B5C3F